MAAATDRASADPNAISWARDNPNHRAQLGIHRCHLLTDQHATGRAVVGVLGLCQENAVGD